MRTDKQIMAAAQRDIRLLTDKEYDRYREIQDSRSVNKVGVGMVKGFNPIARPQRFKGVF